MENVFFIDERCLYDYCVERGYEPLTDRRFPMEINLRIEIQREKFGHCVFGRGEDIAVANARFFRWVWDKSPVHICEECGRPLGSFSAGYCSHILSRGAHPEMAHDPRNINLLCLKHHEQWEHETTRKSMRIYPGNLMRIEVLRKEYENKRTKTNKD